MTQEEKVRAYDNAFNVALETYKTQPMYRDWLEKMFPELAESDDERIRKALIDMVECAYKRGAIILGEKEKEKYIAWLEKQEGCEHIKKDWLEHIKQSWYKEGFIDGKYSGGTSKEWTINDATTLKELIDFLENGTAKLQHDLTRYANWLKIQFSLIEKQGQKSQGKSVLEAAQEEKVDNQNCVKPIDKVEQKFHEGDWITIKE